MPCYLNMDKLLNKREDDVNEIQIHEVRFFFVTEYIYFLIGFHFFRVKFDSVTVVDATRAGKFDSVTVVDATRAGKAYECFSEVPGKKLINILWKKNVL